MIKLALKSVVFVGALTLMASAPSVSFAADGGGISSEMLGRLRSAQDRSAQHRALRNAVAQTDLQTLATNAENAQPVDAHMSVKVNSKGITNQRQSGRCWLFTGLNVLRAKMMADNDLGKLELSQNYNFFYDQLEKSNLFLQAIIDTRSLAMDDKKVEFLFKNPISDGGQYTGLSENVMKYGVVPAEVWPETYSSNNTSQLRRLLGLKLREYGLELRKMASNGAKAKQLTERKEQMLSQIYGMLTLTLGEPPTEFEWTRRDSKGKVVDRRTYTPLEFFNTYAPGDDLQADYVMLMNDPTREYHKLYEIDLDRHIYDGRNWTYINLPIEEIKEAAIASLKDSSMMYFSCDVGQSFDRKRGLLDVDNYNYGDLFNTTFSMDKADRIRTFASASSHAMTLMGVDLDASGIPTKWMVENSWGPGANDGHLVMTDRWFDEYMFRLVVNKKYLPESILSILKQKPQLLPAWDPMFSYEE